MEPKRSQQIESARPAVLSGEEPRRAAVPDEACVEDERVRGMNPLVAQAGGG
jgi:hypothetical protein